MKEIRLRTVLHYRGWKFRTGQVHEELPEVGGSIYGIEVIEKVERLRWTADSDGQMYGIYGVSGLWDNEPAVELIAVLAEEEE